MVESATEKSSERVLVGRVREGDITKGTLNAERKFNVFSLSILLSYTININLTKSKTCDERSLRQ